MVTASGSVRAVALAFAPALWALSGGGPAAAHPSGDPDCYAPPFSLLVSPCVPHDVPAGPSATVAELAIFAWQEFIALNWVAMDPPTSGLRGRPVAPTDPTSGSSGSRQTPRATSPWSSGRPTGTRTSCSRPTGTPSPASTRRSQPTSTRTSPRRRLAVRSRASVCSTISTRRARSAWTTCMPTPPPPCSRPHPRRRRGRAWPTRQKSTVRYSTMSSRTASPTPGPAATPIPR